MTKTILFLCAHGGAKSVIASAAFNQLAAEESLPFLAVAAAAEEPYASVPEPVSEYLLSTGVDVRAFKPRHVDASQIGEAAKVVSIGCDLPLSIESDRLEHWEDVPNASDGVDASAAAIRRHVETLLKDLRGD